MYFALPGITFLASLNAGFKSLAAVMGPPPTASKPISAASTSCPAAAIPARSPTAPPTPSTAPGPKTLKADLSGFRIADFAIVVPSLPARPEVKASIAPMVTPRATDFLLILLIFSSSSNTARMFSFVKGLPASSFCRSSADIGGCGFKHPACTQKCTSQSPSSCTK